MLLSVSRGLWMLYSAARVSVGGSGAGGCFNFFSVKYLRSVEISEIKEVPVYRKIQLYFHGGYKNSVS